MPNYVTITWNCLEVNPKESALDKDIALCQLSWSVLLCENNEKERASEREEEEGDQHCPEVANLGLDLA